jgi:hypothetical protein
MANLTQITPHLWSLEAPTAIRDLPGWVCWRFEDHPGDKKPRKMPYYANGAKRSGEQGSREDIAHLVTFEAARAAAVRRGFDGVGFATLEQWGVVAVDVDNCVTGGEIHPDIEPLICQSYSEFSPSGQGVRLFFRGNLGNGKDLSGSYGLEFFSTKGYVTFTGNSLPGCELLGLENTVAPVPRELMDLHRSRFARDSVPESTSPIGLTTAQIEQCLAALPGTLHYDDWLRVGMAIHCETGGKGFELWEAWSEKSEKHGGRRYDQERWRSFGKGSGLQVTGASLVSVANKYGAGVMLNAPASAYEFDVLVEAASEPASEAAPIKFPVIPAAAFSSGEPPQWIVKHVLPAAELVVLYGASGSGKSFLALDIAGCIARGVPWRGKRVRQGRVVYIAAEGAGGFRNRLKAYGIANELDLNGLDIGVIHAAPNFLDKTDAAAVAASVKSSGGASVIIVDTFAQTTAGGDENSGEDMGKALSHCKALHRHTGAVVLLVHHSGKDTSKGARGWSGIRAAADAELEVVREESGRWLRLSKQKDGEDELRWGFDLEVVQLGVDEDLDPVTSCVVIEAEVPVAEGQKRVLGPVEKVVMDVVRGQCAGGLRAPVEGVVSEAAGRLVKPEGARDTRRQRVRQSLNRLISADSAGVSIVDEHVVFGMLGDFLSGF